ncbi:MAG: hypothetical protein RL757_2053 [Bacteroidota bacterium]|jgi:5'-nucleotidase
MKKNLILVTNDDSIHAKGIAALVEAVRGLGEVIVVAPETPQSAKGHAITIYDPIRLRKVDKFEGIESWACTGTPVDCVKIAKHAILKGRKIDLVVSGINHGSNASINILYSGTMSAAMEGSVEGIPSVGFSLLDFSHDADFDAATIVAKKVTKFMLKNCLDRKILLNVNVPKLPISDIKGFKICRQAEARWEEDFVENTDPNGKTYYWLTGKFHCDDLQNQSDIGALEAGYVSIVPSIHDLTDYKNTEFLKSAKIEAL